MQWRWARGDLTCEDLRFGGTLAAFDQPSSQVVEPRHPAVVTAVKPFRDGWVDGGNV